MKHQDELKQSVGKAAVKFIEDGMTVGLGTGSTVKFMVDALGERVAQLEKVAEAHEDGQHPRLLASAARSTGQLDRIPPRHRLAQSMVLVGI